MNKVSILFSLSFLLSIQLFSQTKPLECDDIKIISGQNFISKPSICERLSGCKNIYLPIPYNGTFVWGTFASYLRDLGLTVIEVPIKFDKDQQNLNGATGTYIYPSKEPFYTGEINDLVVYLSLGDFTGQYISKRFAKISFIDNYNSYSWDFDINVPASSVQIYKKNLFNGICYSRTYMTSKAVIATKRYTCWNENTIKVEFQSNGIDNYEGIYEKVINSNSNEPKYRVAVKRIKEKYYLLYLSGANTSDWEEGEIKASLEPTATINLFNSKWLMLNKQENSNCYIIFETGFMNVFLDNTKDIYIKVFPTVNDNIKNNSNIPASGTGFAIASNGLIATNNHVIEGAKSIIVRGINGDFTKTYTANILTSDKNNDLAIIKINDPNFTSFGHIPYIIKSGISNVGEEVFVLGYPLRATMGDEIKLTNGIISSKTGFQNDITSYQISAPVQPGNSGGPLFDKQGNVIGVVNAKHIGAENVSYAIKISYLLNLIDLLDGTPVQTQVSSLNGKTLTQQVSIINKYVYIVEVK